MNSIRHYAHQEQVLEIGYRGWLHQLETNGWLNAKTREEVIARLLGAQKRSEDGLMCKEVGWLLIMIRYAYDRDMPFEALRWRCELMRDYPAALKQ